MFYQGYCDWCTLSIENASHTIQGDLTALSNQTTPTTPPTVSSWIDRSENCTNSSLVPRLPGTQNVHVWRAWYLFSCDHDVIKIGPEFLQQKGNVLLIISCSRAEEPGNKATPTLLWTAFSEQIGLGMRLKARLGMRLEHNSSLVPRPLPDFISQL